jgi:hypothetical protein
MQCAEKASHKPVIPCSSPTGNCYSDTSTLTSALPACPDLPGVYQLCQAAAGVACTTQTYLALASDTACRAISSSAWAARTYSMMQQADMDWSGTVIISHPQGCVP